jgi:hypothetical protein
MITENLRKELNTGKIFNVTFVKKNGAIRNLNARLGVKSHLRGGKLTYDPASRNNLIVFSMNDKGYRTVNINTIIEIKINGKTYKNLELSE